MVSHNRPSPTAKDKKSKKTWRKASKPPDRASKRVKNAPAALHCDSIAGAARVDDRHTRVWKACERCRMRKTKCDGKFPCKRCKDDQLVCAAGIRKKPSYKQLPRGYAEVLENAQHTLITTIHKLYSMVRSSQPWKFGEPDLNNQGQPIIHDIAQKLGCIQQNCGIDLPVHSCFPEDVASMAELARQLEQQKPHDHDVSSTNSATAASRYSESSAYNRADRAYSSGLDHSDMEQDHRKMDLGNHNALFISPQSSASGSDLESSVTPIDIDTVPMLWTQTLSMQDFSSSWTMAPMAQQQQRSPTTISMSLIQQPSSLYNVVMVDQNVLDADFGIINVDNMSHVNSDSTMRMADAVLYAGFDNDI